MKNKKIQEIEHELDKKTPNEKIISLILKMTGKGILSNQYQNDVVDGVYGEIDRKGVFTPGKAWFSFTKNKYDKYREEWMQIQTKLIRIDFADRTFVWSSEITNPDKLILFLIKRHNEANAKVAEIDIMLPEEDKAKIKNYSVMDVICR